MYSEKNRLHGKLSPAAQNVGAVLHAAATRKLVRMRAAAVMALAMLLCSAQSVYAAIAFRAASSAAVQTQVGVTPSFIASATGNAGASGAISLTINRPAGTLTNHVMLAQITVKGVVAAITAPANWNLLNLSSTSTAGSEITQAVYWHVAVVGEPASYTWSWPVSARAAGGIATFSNVETANPVDVWAVRTTNTSATITVPAITTTSGNDMLVALLGSSTTSSHTTATGMNENYDAATGAGPNGVTLSNNTFLQVSIAAIAAKTATTGSAVDNIAHMIALRPVGALTINVPAGTTVNDVMIASVSYRPCSNTSGGACTTTILAPAGWIQVNSVTNQQSGGGTDGFGNRLFVYQRVVTGVEPLSYTWYFGGTPMQAGAAGGIATFSGVDTAFPINVQAGQTTASSRTHTAPSITPTVANTMLVSTHLINSSATWTPPTGMTERVDIASRTPANDLGIALEMNTEVRAAAGATGTRAATSSNPPAADTGITHMLALRPASTGLDHLEIIHASGEGLTCVASTLTVRACADVACTTLYTGGLSGTLTATGTPVVNWVGGNGDFTIATGSGSVTKDMQVASAGTVVFGIATPSPVPLNVTSCNFGSPVCTFTASLAGFIFSDSATGSGYTIPAQISGIATATLYLRAVQASTTNPAVCTPAIVSAISTVDLGYTCNNPLTCQAGNLLGISNVTTNSATDIAGSPNSNPLQNSTAVSLNFDANGSAPLTARYDDVGLITLNANKSITPFGTATAVMLSGSSNAYVVKPHRFLLSAIQCTTADAANCGAGALAMPTAGDNPAAASAAGVSFIRAGHPFSMTVTAVNSSGNATGNYGREISPEGVRLTPNNAVAGMVAAPAIGGAFGAFNAGAASGTAFTWGEVGIITLTPAVGDADYLGAGNVTGTTSGNVGRFYPEHFDTVITQVAGVPMACPTGLSCPADYNGFVYSGQEFSLSVTARNAAGATTANYNTTTGFAKSTALTAFGVLGTTTAVSGAGTLGVTSVTVFAAGTLTDATQKYNFTAAETAPSNIYIRAADGEATSLRAINPTTTSVEGGVAVVSGRIKVSNAYGSELLPLQLSATAQYYNAGNWLTSTTDNLTNLTLAATYNLIKNASISGTTSASKTPVTGLSAGKLTINLTRPSGGATGIATISPVAPGYLPVIPGTATFGVYKGSNDLFIYQREAY